MGNVSCSTSCVRIGCAHGARCLMPASRPVGRHVKTRNDPMRRHIVRSVQTRPSSLSSNQRADAGARVGVSSNGGEKRTIEVSLRGTDPTVDGLAANRVNSPHARSTRRVRACQQCYGSSPVVRDAGTVLAPIYIHSSIYRIAAPTYGIAMHREARCS